MRSRKKLYNVAVQQRLVIIVVVLLIAISIARPAFLRVYNIRNLVLHISTNGIMAVGMTIVLISGAFDLSIGSVMSFTGIVAIMLLPYFCLGLSVAFALFLGAGCGLLNGIMITKGKVNPFIATLGTMVMIKGLSLAITGSEPISPQDEAFSTIGWGEFLGVPNPILVMVMIATITWFFLRYTNTGRNVYAIGGNEFSCRLAGIEVNRHKVLYFTICSFLAGVAGIIVSSRANIGSAVLGDTIPLVVIALVVLGGTSLSGGKGSILGTMFGLLVFGLIDNAMVLLGVYSYYQFVVRGMIILFVILLDTVIGKAR